MSNARSPDEGPLPRANDDPRESLKTQIVGLLETLTEATMSGEVTGLVILGIDGDGEVLSKVIGLRLTEAAGLCGLGQTVMLRKLLA